MQNVHSPTLADAAARRRIRQGLLRWFDRYRRELPWRAAPVSAKAEAPYANPYRVWISEIMLQQTRVAAVLEHYVRFLRRFPDVQSLAGARLASVLAAWSGLGYYRRARLLHAAARQIVGERGGKFPEDSAGLRELPGIGRYTAAAIASICYGERSAVVDGNVKRVLGRLLGVNGSLVWAAANRLLSWLRPGDCNQAMMELGATVCTPRAPKCELCPVRPWCADRTLVAGGKPATSVLSPLLRGARTNTPAHKGSPRQKRGELSYRLLVNSNQVLLTLRGEQEAVMPGLWELPHAQAHEAAQFTLRHAIMDTEYRVRVVRSGAVDACGGNPSAKWFPVKRAAKLPLTGVTRKILRHAKLIE